MRCLLLVLSFLLVAASVQADGSLPRWDDQAEQRFDADQRERIGRSYVEDVQDHAEAMRWYRSVAEEGESPTALAYMGWFHEHGLGVSQDGDKAVTWYERAVDAGAERYILHLAWLHMDGQLVPRDRDVAEGWFRKGVERDMPEARLAYGSVLYADLLGSGVDDRAATGARAERLLLAALKDGKFAATRFLARMYLDGTGVEQDVERGLNTVRLGAEVGDAAMQGLLANILAEGRLLEQDLVTANMWATLAAAGGEEQADSLRRSLDSRLDEEQRRQSRCAGRRWAEKQQ
ncbi:sel1 repeat family protein [Methylonatrum kenyense]|uniref:tetratricopeptide repeat protein n=1 Tax=Methylonatrum kenyense TaxID=455253 RepID=UPI0020BE9FF7|nr:tetratricopeptide repeat protein [Methylonatrum kenyense]MCK8515104.1 sel1 repeat family protein [Methylonatrum kenyense]